MFTDAELYEFIEGYLARFNMQRDNQHIPENTCPLIDKSLVTAATHDNAVATMRLESVKSAN
jgi:hypothetical protein